MGDGRIGPVARDLGEVDHFRDKRTKNFQNNLTNRRGDCYLLRLMPAA